MSLALLFHYLLLKVFRMLVYSASGASDLLRIYFMCCITLVRCVLVLRCGILMQAEALQCFSLHKDTTPPQPNHTVTPTHIETEQYNTWNKSTISRKLLKMDVLTFETCSAVNSEIIKQVTSSWSIFIQLSVWDLAALFSLCVSTFGSVIALNPPNGFWRFDWRCYVKCSSYFNLNLSLSILMIIRVNICLPFNH
jgi:hypothetical protein